ncbi:peptide-N(4)-(N-acetyl-beta-glucosaminyl)asparagine amidase-like isoform X1 [Asterias rubens]|uniref:peptide-N(4)-(N-acetyl-beta- glucosaminyl)asparagine amidase-like isoform X1 n=1 Tax=Asterias rubens TaxID=7604 RepID=UPI0014557F18|nr:peptide-N(4)-(N-acetyl-beta-glucosaminyl)asparagine amidase-like isoform X1 [Asterias rubens]
MASNEELAVVTNQLLENGPSVFLDASEILLRFANNIIRSPNVSKFRSIRLGNKIFEKRILPVSGAVECLFLMGFEENDDHLVFPENAVQKDMIKMQERLARERLKLMAKQISASSTWNIQASELTFHQRLRSSAEHVLIYEDPILQQKARDCMALPKLLRKAAESLQQQAANTTGTDDITNPLDQRDLLLLELLKWFKTSFFKWMDSPTCETCNIRMRSVGLVEPNAEDRRWGAGRVEGYTCTRCNRPERFPRYNHPGKLLETRKGRCGEWANCFTLCCRAAGFEARHIVDWTDHVWTEVYSQSQQRWLHCDPCENVCDKPLLYERGWSKKLSYLIAFSNEEVVDVSWRYTANPKDLLGRRKECREEWLMDIITTMNRERQRNLMESRRAVLEQRSAVELAEFLSPKVIRNGEEQGRLSGSIAWRLARGETRGDTRGDTLPTNEEGVAATASEGYVFKLTPGETSQKCLHLKYCPASDKYIRISSDSQQTKDYRTCVYQSQNIYRKEEYDWNMVYVARDSGDTPGHIAWRFDLKESGLVVESITIAVAAKTYQNGKVVWKVFADGRPPKELPVNEEIQFTTITAPISGEDTVNLSADLTGGTGDVAYQHAQIFRIGLEDYDRYPLDIMIRLKAK